MKAVKDSRGPFSSLLPPSLHWAELRRGLGRIHQGLARPPVRAAEMKTFIWMEVLSLRASAACIFSRLTVMRFRRLPWAVPVVPLPSELALGTLNHLGHWHGSAIHGLSSIHPCVCHHSTKPKTRNPPSPDAGFAASPLRLIHLQEVKLRGENVSEHFCNWSQASV